MMIFSTATLSLITVAEGGNEIWFEASVRSVVQVLVISLCDLRQLVHQVRDDWNMSHGHSGEERLTVVMLLSRNLRRAKDFPKILVVHGLSSHGQ